MLKRILGTTIVIIFFSLLVMLSAQETFRDILEPLGLYHSRKGVLAECNKPENRKLRYCQENYQPPTNEDFKDLKDGSGFSLTGK